MADLKKVMVYLRDRILEQSISTIKVRDLLARLEALLHNQAETSTEDGGEGEEIYFEEAVDDEANSEEDDEEEHVNKRVKRPMTREAAEKMLEMILTVCEKVERFCNYITRSSSSSKPAPL